MLFTCVLLGLSSAPIYAASEDSIQSSEVPSIVIPEEYLDPVYDKLAYGDVRAVEYSTTDIYNLLQSALNGSSYLSAYSLPQIASQIRRISTILYGSGQSVPSSGNLFDNLNTYLSASDGGSRVGIGTLAMNMQYDLTDIKNYTSSISSSISSLDSISWLNTGASYLGAKRSPTGSVVSSWVTGERDWFFGFNFAGSTYSSNQPMTLRLWIPFDPWNQIGSPNFRLKSIQYVSGGSAYPVNFDNSNVFFEPGINYGSYVYIFNFKDYNLGYSDIYFEVEYIGSGSPQMSGDRQGNAFYLPFDSAFNQQLKVAFYQSSMSSDISSLRDVLADSSEVAAKQASQPVIDDTLSGFTGSGSAAAKTSDTGGMKNMSSSLQSGLDTGASVSNAASVFSNTTFWTWFSQDNSNKINQPYPAPEVPRLRGSGDEIVDFLSGNQQELDSLLNQRNSW